MVFTTKWKDPHPDHFGPNRPRRVFNQAPQNNTQVVKSIFKEPAYRVLEEIKNRPYFKWQTRWVVIPPDEIRAYIVSIIMTKAT